MGTLGKVLLVVNLLAAFGLTYFAAQDWTQRRKVQAAALQHFVAVKGLPVEGPATADDTVPFPIELTGGQATDSVRKSFLVEYFKGTDGGGNFGDPTPPVSQLAELGRVKAKVQAVVAGLPGPAEKLAYLCGSLNGSSFTPGLLARLAGCYEERAAAVDLATRPGDKAADAATAEAALARRFESAESIRADQSAADSAVVKEKSEAAKKANADAKAAFDAWQQNLTNAMALDTYRKAVEGLRAAQDDEAKSLLALGSSAAKDVGDRRRKVAHLLGELDGSAAWQQRVARVVGLRAYRESVGERVDRLREFARSAQAQAVAEQVEFNDTFERLKQQADARTRILLQQQGITADLVAQQAKEREATALRRGQFVTRQADLAAVRTEVADALARQTAVEAELVAVQKKVGEALRSNFGLEDQLKAAEYKAGGAQ